MVLRDVPGCNPVCQVCHYKALTYEAQLIRKQEWALKQLAPWKDTLRKIREAPVTERIGYRAKSWMRAGRANSISGPASFGMFRAVNIAGEWEQEFISWDECPLHTDGIQTTLSKIRARLPEEVDPEFFGLWFGSPHVVWISQRGEPPSGLDWSTLLEPPFDRVWFHQTSQVGKKVFGAKPITQIFGPPSDALHPIRAFRQVASTLLREAREKASGALAEGSPKIVLDLYCGTGELSLLLPKETGWIGIEQSKEAVAYANTISSRVLHQAFEGAVEQRLSDSRILDRIQAPYAIYINPPRPGLTREAREKIFALTERRVPTSVVYLSCSASSLARDLHDFTARGFRVRELQPYDFFPQTEHFETLAVLTRV